MQWRIQKGAWGCRPSKIGQYLAKLAHFLPILASTPPDHPGSAPENEGKKSIPFLAENLHLFDWLPIFMNNPVMITKIC